MCIKLIIIVFSYPLLNLFNSVDSGAPPPPSPDDDGIPPLGFPLPIDNQILLLIIGAVLIGLYFTLCKRNLHVAKEFFEDRKLK